MGIASKNVLCGMSIKENSLGGINPSPGNNWSNDQFIGSINCFHHFFEAQVLRTPDAIAVMSHQGSLTYTQLNQRSNQLAHYLRGLGVSPEVLVGVCAEPSLQMIVSLLATLKAGGAYVPLDPAYPENRLAFILQDTQVSVILTQEHLLCVLPDTKAQVIALADDWQAFADQSEENLESGATSENLAYVIHTSGSTGQPKGVMIPHAGIINQLHWRLTTFPLTECDRVLQNISFSFDPSVWQIFWPLACGAQVVLPKPGGQKDLAYLLELIRQQQVTVIALVPSMLRVLLEQPGFEVCRGLRYMFCGGEGLPLDLQEKFFERLDLDGVLYNVYGPTEASIDATSWCCERNSKRAIAPIGKPITNAQIYLLDADLQPVADGESGEIYIGGAGLARGYLNRPDLTAEKFVLNPFGQPGDRLYRTGDLGRYLPDGNIEFLGRIDYQVKIRGFRIELGEIEAVLKQFPGIRDGVVVVREDVPGNKRLVAYYIPETEVIEPKHLLRAYLANKLPPYMVPATFVEMAEFPLNPNGKLDRRALPAPEQQTCFDSVFVAPKDAFEIGLAQIWEELLGVQPIGVKDNFFELGGDSLMTVQLFSKIEQQFGKKLPLSTLVTAPTIAQLAQVLRSNVSTIREMTVLLKQGTGRSSFFIIHDGDGETLLYRSLANRLSPSVSVYGVQPYGSDEFPILHARIEEMAASYIRAIRKVQPEGPYLLGGLCAGGVLAFEVAVQLQQQGQQVGMVAIIDAADVKATEKGGYILNQRIDRFSTIFHKSTKMKPHRQVLFLLNQLKQRTVNLISYEVRKNYETLRDQFQLVFFKYFLDHDMQLPAFVKHIPVRNILALAREQYTPQRLFDGEIQLYRATKRSPIFDNTPIDDTPYIERFSDPLLGWGKRATAGVQAYDIPGGHSSMLQEPNVQVIAEKIQSHIDKVELHAEAMQSLASPLLPAP